MQVSETLIQRLLQSRVGPGLLGLIAIVLIAYTLWQAGSGLQDTQPIVSDSAPATSDNPQVKPQALASQLSTLHLFGQPKTGASSGSPVPENIPDTKLKLELHGLYVEEPAGSAFAIIQKQGKEQQHFIVGQSVFGLAELQAIYLDRVILNRKGRLEILRLPRQRAPVVFTASPIVDNPQKVTGSPIMLQHFEYHMSLSSQEFDDDSDADAIAGFSVEPATSAGRAWLEQLNMAPGDVIIEVNGNRLDREEKIEILEQALESGSSVAVTVDRNGTVYSTMLTAPGPGVFEKMQ